MKTIDILFTALLVLFTTCITSCEKSEIPYYNEQDAAVRFPVSDNGIYDGILGFNTIDATFYTAYSFLDAGTSNQETVVYNIPVLLIGNPSDKPRTINYTIDSKNSTAPEGSYEIIEAMIPANEYMGHISVKLHNVEELENITYILELTLTNSDQLSAGPKEYVKAQLSWNNQIPAPATANYIRTYNMLIAGETNFISTSKNSYSNKALRVIVDALGWTDWDDPNAHNGMYNTDGYKYLPRYAFLYNDNSYQAYSAKVGAYIEKYNREHPDTPLVHDGGKNVGKPIKSRY